MKIVMTQTAKGAVTSTDVRDYEAGREYDVPGDLGAAFISMGVAEAVDPAAGDVDTKPAPVVETKPAKSPKRKG